LNKLKIKNNNMKKSVLSSVLSIVILLGTITLTAQEDEKKSGYEFKIVKELPTTSVKNQFRSGTCWSFAGLSFIESELLRMGKGTHDLSDMFVVRYTYQDKAVNYVRFHGNLNFGSGGAFHDVINVIKKYGIVPENVYDGLKYGEDKHVHFEMDEILQAYAEAVVKNKNKKITPVWLEGFNGVLDAYLGKLPENFTYNGKTHTALSFTKELGINADDYMYLTSFTHHPFYTQFVMELPDNWALGSVHNIPLESLWQVVVEAINNGYTVAWATDVSEKGFSWKNGLAIVPDIKIEQLDDTERARWESLTEKERNEQLYKFDKPGLEKHITQEMRQIAFDNYETTDDHGMHIVGIAKDQNGNEYLKVKNSWSDEKHIYDGYLYASKAFFLYKTTNIMLHKNALPKKVKKDLGL